MAKNFKVKLLGENHNGSYMHYEILINEKRFINGWIKTDNFKYWWMPGYIEGNLSVEHKIINHLINQYYNIIQKGL